jgi:hypothetical protein
MVQLLLGSTVKELLICENQSKSVYEDGGLNFTLFSCNDMEKSAIHNKGSYFLVAYLGDL